MASSGEDRPVISTNGGGDGNNVNPRNANTGVSDSPNLMSSTAANQTTNSPQSASLDSTVSSQAGVRHRAVTNAGHPVAQTQASPDPLQLRPGETPQERRRRRLRRDREQLLSLINANPIACLCILVAASFVVVGVGYFLYELHLAYKYSSIIHKLHVSSLKDGYGAPASFSSSQKSHQGKAKTPPAGSSSNAPSSPEIKKLPMLDEETEMYAKQLQTVLGNLKRTINRIEASNSTTSIAGLVELKPFGSKDDEVGDPGFTTEINSEDAKPNAATSNTSPNEDLYTFLTKGLGKNAKAKQEPQQAEQDASAPSKVQQSFPDYLRDLKASLEAEAKRAQDKWDDWIDKHRHEYTNEEEWNEAVELKKAKEDDYNRFLDAMFYVAEELEQDYSEGGMGAVENNNEEDAVTLGKLLEILAKGARSNDDDIDEYAYSSDVSGDADSDSAKSTKQSKSGKSDNEQDWAYEMWDEDEDDDWDDRSQEDREEAEPQFA